MRWLRNNRNSNRPRRERAIMADRGFASVAWRTGSQTARAGFTSEQTSIGSSFNLVPEEHMDTNTVLIVLLVLVVLGGGGFGYSRWRSN
jgi:hypothetical protein